MAATVETAGDGPAGPSGLHGQVPLALRIDIAASAALFAVALALRLALFDAPPRQEEGLHLSLARHLFAVPPGMTGIYGDTWWHPGWLVWLRPLWYGIMHVPADSLMALRIVNALWVSLIGVMAYGLLGASGVRRPIRFVAALLLVVDPFILSWTATVFMDGPMVVLVLAGMWAWRRDRFILAGLLLVAAVWVKETAYVALVGLLVWSVTKGVRDREVKVWPLEFSKPMTALLAAALLAPLPIAWGFSKGLQWPVVPATGSVVGLLDGMFWSVWLLPVVLVAFRWSAARLAASLTLLQAAATVFVFAVLGFDVAPADLLLPMAFSILTVAVLLDAAWLSLMRIMEPVRWGRVATMSAMCGVLFLGVMGPAGVPRDVVMGSLTHDRVTLEDVYAGAGTDDALWVAADVLWDAGAERVVIADVDYGNALYPFAARAERSWVAHTSAFEFFALDPKPLAATIENETSFLLLKYLDVPMNEALRQTYGDCAIHDDGERYMVVKAYPTCAGRTDALVAAWKAERAASS